MSELDVTPLAAQGFVNVPYPSELRAGVQEAVAAWEKFCALPEEMKARINYSGDQNVSGVGYELKLELGNKKELKEDFHVRLTEREYLEKEAAKVGAAAQEFLEASFALNALVAPVIAEFAAAVEEKFAMPAFAADTQAKQPRALFRFLHYFGNRKAGDELALPHVDKGGFTLHLYESHPGLEHLTQSRTWEPMAFSTGETAIIPALRMQLRAENRLKATCHRVVANEETAKNGRFSAVCFMDFANTGYFDKARHGRQQDRALAFNYDMSFAEFASLFTAD